MSRFQVQQKEGKKHSNNHSISPMEQPKQNGNQPEGNSILPNQMSNFQDQHTSQMHSMTQNDNATATARNRASQGQENRPRHHHKRKTHHYEPLKIPCDWNFAYRHGLSRRVARDIEGEDVTTCPCCGYQVEKIELAIDCDPQELRFLGSGFPLFYNFIKFCIFILFQQFLLKGLFCISTDLMGNYCENTPVAGEGHSHKHVGHVAKTEVDKEIECPNMFWYFISLANIYDRPDLRNLQTSLSLLVVAANMITLLFFRRAQRQIDIEIDESQLTPADYTICVKNIPKGLDIDYKAHLANIFSHYSVTGRELEVIKIVLVYDIDEIIELEEELKNEVIVKKQKILAENKLDFTDNRVKEIDKEISELEHKIEKILKELPKQPDKFTGKAFISFLTEEMKELVLKNNTHDFWERVRAYNAGGIKENPSAEELILEGHKLYCEQAPEPNDVDWEFMHVPTKSKITARVKAWSISIAFMSGCFIVIWVLSILTDKMNDKVEEQEEAGIKDVTSQVIATTLSLSISWTIILFNKFVIGKVYHLIVDMEKVSNKTAFNISFAYKQSIALFINTALISLVIDFFITGNIIGPGGFIYNETNVFLLNAFIPPIVWFVDPWSLKMDYLRNKAMKNSKNSVLTQQQASELMEMPDYSQAKRYGDIMKTMWFTFFYGDIIPVGTLFSILGLSLYYLVDKFNVLRRRTIKENLSKDLSIAMIDMLELIIFFQGSGNLTVNFVLFHEVHWEDICIISISVLYLLLPMEGISQMLFPIKQHAETAQYWEAQDDFDTDYDRENPVTRKEAMMDMHRRDDK